MDLSDDIAYSVHDFEDAINAGRFQLRWIKDAEQRARVIKFTRSGICGRFDDDVIDARHPPSRSDHRMDAPLRWIAAFNGRAQEPDKPAHRPFLPVRRSTPPANNTVTGASSASTPSSSSREITEPRSPCSRASSPPIVMTSDERQPIYERQRQVLTNSPRCCMKPARSTSIRSLPPTGGMPRTTLAASVSSSTRWPPSPTPRPSNGMPPWWTARASTTGSSRTATGVGIRGCPLRVTGVAALPVSSSTPAPRLVPGLAAVTRLGAWPA